MSRIRITAFTPLTLAFLSAILLALTPLARGGMFIEAPHISLAGEGGGTVIADFNLDGKPDMLVSTFLSTGVNVFLGNGDGTFQAAIFLPLPDTSGSYAVADFNGDGKPDFMLGDATAGTITFYRGNGDGTFQAGVATSSTNPFPLAAGDLNGDGKVDLVTRSWERNALGVNVLLGNGNGTFQPEAYFAAQHLVWVVQLADVNNDGKLDVIGGDFIGTNSFISVLLGNGDGTFQAHKEFASGNSSAYSLAVADFNGDGKKDVLVNNRDLNSLSLLLGNGDGTFQKFTAIPDAGGPYAVVAADFNGDGKVDIASANVNDNSVSILLGNGNGTFQPALEFATGQSPTGLAAGDLNRDGKVDLVTADQGVGGRNSTLTLLFGLGNGALVAAGVYDTATQAPSRLASGDFNGDGNPDLVANSASSMFSLFLGNSDGTFKQASRTDVVKAPSDIAVGDFNNDGKLDVVTCNNSTNSGTVSVVLGNGDGTFQPHVDVTLPLHPLWVATGDFNRDGNLDVAVVEWTPPRSDISVFLGNGDGTLQTPVAYGFPGRGSALAVADVNGDGNPDLVVAHDKLLIVLPGKGDGSFRSPITSTAPGSIFSFGLGDLNEDGKLDVVVSVENSVAVMIGGGDGTFQPAVSRYTPAGGYVSLADLNRDGHLDVLTGNRSRLGNGDGSLRTAQSISGGSEIAVDFNGDGYPDVANANFGGGTGHTIVVELNKGGTPGK